MIGRRTVEVCSVPATAVACDEMLGDFAFLVRAHVAILVCILEYWKEAVPCITALRDIACFHIHHTPVFIFECVVVLPTNDPFKLVTTRAVESGTQKRRQPWARKANGCSARSCRISLCPLWRIVESYSCTE